MDDEKNKKGFLSKLFSSQILRWGVGAAFTFATGFAGAAVYDVTWVDYIHDANNELMAGWKQKMKSYFDGVPAAFFSEDGMFSGLVEWVAEDEISQIRTDKAAAQAEEAARIATAEAQAQAEATKPQSGPLSNVVPFERPDVTESAPVASSDYDLDIPELAI